MVKTIIWTPRNTTMHQVSDLESDIDALRSENEDQTRTIIQLEDELKKMKLYSSVVSFVI